jgi:glycogen synthase
VSRRAVSRVLILSWEYPPIVEGGLARHVRKLSEQLVRDGVEVHVLTRGDRERFRLPGETLVPRARLRRRYIEEVRHGVIVHRVREPDFPRDDVDAFIAWVDHMNADMSAAGLELGSGFDLVHSHDWLVAAAARKLARRWRVPWLVTVHATEYGRHQGWVDKHPQSHIHGVERRMVRAADRVITCSAYMREHVAGAFGIAARRVRVIPNGIDPTDLQPVEDLPRLRAQFAAPDEKLVLLVGRLVYEKGFHLALDAMPRLIRRLGRVRFVVAGSGTAEAELKEQAEELGLMEHGTFVGWTGDDVLHSLYRIADLCLVPSIYEPFGLVALEAMASGCPCIVADTGGLREVVPAGERVGLRFRARDSASLARMAAKLLADDALRDRLVAQAREHVLQFDWADVARQTEAVYEELRGARV